MTKKEEERFSMREVIRQSHGETGSVKSNRSTERANKKVSETSGKYEVRYVDGIKYMTLKSKK
jgi:hypothetical protein